MFMNTYHFIFRPVYSVPLSSRLTIQIKIHVSKWIENPIQIQSQFNSLYKILTMDCQSHYNPLCSLLNGDFSWLSFKIFSWATIQEGVLTIKIEQKLEICINSRSIKYLMLNSGITSRAFYVLRNIFFLTEFYNIFKRDNSRGCFDNQNRTRTQVSISSTFYSRLFHTKVFLAAFT